MPSLRVNSVLAHVSRTHKVYMECFGTCANIERALYIQVTLAFSTDLCVIICNFMSHILRKLYPVYAARGLNLACVSNASTQAMARDVYREGLAHRLLSLKSL